MSNAPVVPPAVGRLIDVATEEYAESGESFCLVAVPAGIGFNRCEDGDPAWGEIADGVLRVPWGCVAVMGEADLGKIGRYNVLAFAPPHRPHLKTQLDRFVAFAKKAGPILIAWPPAWMPSVPPGDSPALWAAALLLCAPIAPVHVVERKGGARFLDQAWRASLEALRRWPPATPPAGPDVGAIMFAFDALRDPLERALACARRIAELSAAELNSPGVFRDEIRRLARDLPHLTQQTLAAFHGEPRLDADLRHEFRCVEEDAVRLASWVPQMADQLRAVLEADRADPSNPRYGSAVKEAGSECQEQQRTVYESCNRAHVTAVRVCTDTDKAAKKPIDAGPTGPTEAPVTLSAGGVTWTVPEPHSVEVVDEQSGRTCQVDLTAARCWAATLDGSGQRLYRLPAGWALRTPAVPHDAWQLLTPRQALVWLQRHGHEPPEELLSALKAQLSAVQANITSADPTMPTLPAEELTRIEGNLDAVFLAPPRGSGGVLTPAPTHVSAATKEALKQRPSANHPLKAVAGAMLLLMQTGRLMDLLRSASDPKDTADPERSDRLTVGAIQSLWESIQTGRLLLGLWSSEIAEARELRPYRCPRGDYTSATHAVQDLAETMLAEVWRVAWVSTEPPGPYPAGHEIPYDTWQPARMPPFRLDWWYAALPALRRHYSGAADRWGLGEGEDETDTVWDAGLKTEADLLGTWRCSDPPATPPAAPLTMRNVATLDLVVLGVRAQRLARILAGVYSPGAEVKVLEVQARAAGAELHAEAARQGLSDAGAAVALEGDADRCQAVETILVTARRFSPPSAPDFTEWGVLRRDLEKAVGMLKLWGLLPNDLEAVTDPARERPEQTDSAADLTAEERAIAVFLRDPDRYPSDRALAKQIGCDPSLLSGKRSPKLRALREAYARKVPKGSKSKEGDVEAEAEDEEEDEDE